MSEPALWPSSASWSVPWSLGKDNISMKSKRCHEELFRGYLERALRICDLPEVQGELASQFYWDVGSSASCWHRCSHDTVGKITPSGRMGQVWERVHSSEALKWLLSPDMSVSRSLLAAKVSESLLCSSLPGMTAGGKKSYYCPHGPCKLSPTLRGVYQLF